MRNQHNAMEKKKQMRWQEKLNSSLTLPEDV